MYSGGERNKHGVAVVLNQRTSNLVKIIHIVSERVMCIKIDTTPVNTFIVQCYSLTLDSAEEEKVKLYDDIRDLLTHNKFQEVVILMGDFNSKVGDEKIKNVVGPYGLGTINSAG